MTGASAPSILAFIRYHTNSEVAAALRRIHPDLRLADAELRQVLTDVRVLAGTNPSMATGGYSGRRMGGPGGDAGAELPAVPAPKGPTAPTSPDGLTRQPPTTITMEDGTTRTGLLLAQGELDAVLLEGRRFVLLSRRGNRYREKPVAPKADWLMYDGSITGNRYSPLDRITSDNAGALTAAWVYAMPNSPRLEVTPVVADGIMYVSGWNEWHALDATTGRELWSYAEPRHEGILSEGGTGANRGMTISGDRVYGITDHAHLLAFDRFTGQRLWDKELGPYLDSYSATSPPLPVGDLLVVGVAGGEEGARGFVDAYRPTGDRVWRWYSVPQRGEPGSDTWVGQALEHGCGATWMPGSYDPKLDLVYWAIGNPCPDIAGEERLGDNLYTSSVVALSASTGTLKWYYQFTPHDTHDWDAVQPMILADEIWRGSPRKLLIHGDRNGMFYVLDRATGEVLLAEPLASKVTWLTGMTKRSQADRRSGIDREPRRHRRLPGRRRRRQLAGRVVQPARQALLRTRQRQLLDLHVARRSPRGERESMVRPRSGDPARAGAAARPAERLSDGHVHPRHGSVHRAQDLGPPDLLQIRRTLDRQRTAVRRRRRRTARSRRADRRGRGERQRLAGDPGDADDLHDRRTSVRRARRRRDDRRLRGPVAAAPRRLVTFAAPAGLITVRRPAMPALHLRRITCLSERQ